MTPKTTSSAWSTNVKYKWAHRDEGEMTLVFHRGIFLLLTDKVIPIDSTVLADAIAKADIAHPPADWTYIVGMWVRPGWKVRPGEKGWNVYGDDGKQKSQKNFERADMARKWCEIRHDRVGLNLRGPKPKNVPAPVEEEE